MFWKHSLEISISAIFTTVSCTFFCHGWTITNVSSWKWTAKSKQSENEQQRKHLELDCMWHASNGKENIIEEVLSCSRKERLKTSGFLLVWTEKLHHLDSSRMRSSRAASECPFVISFPNEFSCSFSFIISGDVSVAIFLMQVIAGLFKFVLSTMPAKDEQPMGPVVLRCVRCPRLACQLLAHLVGAKLTGTLDLRKFCKVKHLEERLFTKLEMPDVSSCWDSSFHSH